jgi:hypothetical protein
LSSLSAGIAQLVEHNLAKVGVASSSLVSRSKSSKQTALFEAPFVFVLASIRQLVVLLEHPIAPWKKAVAKVL